MKKKIKKKLEEKKPPVQQSPVKKEEIPSEPSENDYGGIPMRDLKKNLGCG